MATVGNQYARSKLIQLGLLLGGALLLIAVIPLPFLFRCYKQQWIFCSYALILLVTTTVTTLTRLSQIREIRQRLNLEFHPYRHIRECNFTTPITQDLASVAKAYTCIFVPSLILLHYLAINGLLSGFSSQAILLGISGLYISTLRGYFKQEQPSSSSQSNISTEEFIVFLPIILIFGIDLLAGSPLINLLYSHQCSNPNPIILDTLPDVFNTLLLIVPFIAGLFLYSAYDVYEPLQDLLKHDKEAILRSLGAISTNDIRSQEPEDPDYQTPNRFD